MTTPRPAPRNLTSLAVVSLLAVAAAGCGSDDGGSSGAASVEEFCAEVEALEASQEDDELTPAAVEDFRELTARAPEQIRDALETTADGLERALEIDEDDFDAFFEIVFSPEMIAAAEALEEFSVEECGFPPSDADDDTIDLSEMSVDDDAGDAAAGDVPDLSGVENPLWDDFMDEVPDPNEASLDGLQLYLDQEWSDASWRIALGGGANSFGVSGGEWTIAGPNLGDFAVQVCEATAGYLRDLEPDATIVILDLDTESFDETPLVTGDASGDCNPV